MAVSNFINADGSGWDLNMVATTFWEEDIAHILQIPMGVLVVLILANGSFWRMIIIHLAPYKDMPSRRLWAQGVQVSYIYGALFTLARMGINVPWGPRHLHHQGTSQHMIPDIGDIVRSGFLINTPVLIHLWGKTFNTQPLISELFRSTIASTTSLMYNPTRLTCRTSQLKGLTSPLSFPHVL